MKQLFKILIFLSAGLFVVHPEAGVAALKFDFGTADSPVFPEYTRVSDKNLFETQSTFGFVGNVPSAYYRVRPNPLAADFVWAKEKTTFRVVLPNGAYKAWLMYGDSRYDERFITPLAQMQAIGVNGKVLFADPINGWKDFYTEKHFFRGYSNVYHAQDDFYDKYIKPNFKEATISFEVIDGQVDFELEDLPLCALIIYPLSEAPQVEDDIIYQEKELRRYTSIREVKTEKLNSAPQYSTADKERGYVLYSRLPGDPPLAHDRPFAEEVDATPGTFLAQGQTSNLSLTILPLQDLRNVRVSCSDLVNKTGGAKIPVADLRLEYIEHHEVTTDPQTRKRKTAIYTYKVVPLFIKPFPTRFELMDEGVNRTLLLTVAAGSATPAGVYEGHVTIAPENAPSRQLPIQVRVLPITLPELPILAGRYAMDFDFYYYHYWATQKPFTDPAFVDFIWQRQKQRMQWYQEMGLNSIAWSDFIRGDILDNPVRLKEDSRFIRWMDLYRDMGFKAMPWYGFKNITASRATFPNTPVFSAEWTKKYRELITVIRDMGKERGWPEIVFYLSDELSNEGAKGAEHGSKYAAAAREVEGIRRLASVNGRFEHLLIGQLDILMPNFAFPITKPILEEMKNKNTELWLYNVNDQRFTWGYYPFLTQAKGRYQYYGNSGVGYPYDSFDSSYGDASYAVFFAGPNGPVSLVKALNMREGLSDLRYATLLKHLLEKAKNPQDKAVAQAKTLLAEINALDVDLRNYAIGETAAEDTGFEVAEKMWSPEACQRMRWRIAESILELQSGLDKN